MQLYNVSKEEPNRYLPYNIINCKAIEDLPKLKILHNLLGN